MTDLHPQHEAHLAAARRRLVHLAGIDAKTDAAERRILAAAEERQEAVRADLAKLRPRALTDPQAAAQFAALTTESGRLAEVIARAHQTLGAHPPEGDPA